MAKLSAFSSDLPFFLKTLTRIEKGVKRVKTRTYAFRMSVKWFSDAGNGGFLFGNPRKSLAAAIRNRIRSSNFRKKSSVIEIILFAKASAANCLFRKKEKFRASGELARVFEYRSFIKSKFAFGAFQSRFRISKMVVNVKKIIW